MIFFKFYAYNTIKVFVQKTCEALNKDCIIFLCKITIFIILFITGSIVTFMFIIMVNCSFYFLFCSIKVVIVFILPI